MPKIQDKETPDTLRPYEFHGISLATRGKEALGTCPFCDREGKFSVSIQSGMFRCFVCGQQGNQYTFIRELHEASTISGPNLRQLALNRKFLQSTVLEQWDVRTSLLKKDPVVPGYGIDGKLNQLYRYVKLPEGMRLVPTPTMGHQLHGLNLYKKKVPLVYVCEGPWDAMALYEVLAAAKFEANVIAVPGCNTFLDAWIPFFSGKQVVLLYDSDHPRTHPKTGATIEPAGYSGMKRVAALLASSKEPPASIRYICWGNDGYDPKRPSGYDLRDHLSSGSNMQERIEKWQLLSNLIQPIPENWLGTSATSHSDSAPVALSCESCDSWKRLVSSWKKAMKWTSGLDTALVVMLASIVSTNSVGDQLWVKIVGPASCGKSTLCEAVSVAKKYVLAKSTIRGFHSGFGEEGEDNSLIAQVGGKTLVTKDGDTLLQSPNLGQILSEARDVYDTVSRTHYRNRNSKSYEGVRMTWILCGTASLLAIDQSELGERFLTCVIMDGIDDDLEDEILWRVVNRTERNLGIAADAKNPQSHQDPDMTLAMQLTGGYIEHLRENAQDLLSQTAMSDDAKLQCTRLGKFVAYMRARPGEHSDEAAEREFAARLVSQHARLAKCVAVVMDCKTVDAAAMRVTTKVALDTSRGQTLEMARYLHEARQEGLEVRSLSLYTGHSEEKTRTMLRFLKRIHVVETFVPESAGEKKLTNKPRWRLTEKLCKLYEEVMAYC